MTIDTLASVIISIALSFVSLFYSNFVDRKINRYETISQITNNSLLNEFPKCLEEVFRNISDKKQIGSALETLYKNREMLIYMKYYEPKKYEKVKKKFEKIEDHLVKLEQRSEPMEIETLTKETQSLIKLLYN